MTVNQELNNDVGLYFLNNLFLFHNTFHAVVSWDFTESICVVVLKFDEMPNSIFQK
jgi:hypothetical protein